jgi:hypothetical protein
LGLHCPGGGHFVNLVSAHLNTGLAGRAGDLSKGVVLRFSDNPDRDGAMEGGAFYVALGRDEAFLVGVLHAAFDAHACRRPF